MPESGAAFAVQDLQDHASPWRCYGRALTAGSKPREATRCPSLRICRRGVRVDPARVDRFRQLFGLSAEGPVPPTFAHLMAGDLQLQILTAPAFPLPVLGTVHLGNPIIQRRALRRGERVDIEVRLNDLRTVARGIEHDLLTVVRDADGAEIWQGVSTNLLRTGGRHTPTLAGLAVPWTREWLLTLPADCGRRYATLSGDWNPIHLSSLSARLFGFRRAIIHGMWTYARALAALEPYLPVDDLALDVRFRRPLFLPGRARVVARPQAGGWEWAVQDRNERILHATGSVNLRR